MGGPMAPLPYHSQIAGVCSEGAGGRWFEYRRRRDKRSVIQRAVARLPADGLQTPGRERGGGYCVAIQG